MVYRLPTPSQTPRAARESAEALCLEACRCTHNVSNPPNPKSSKQAPQRNEDETKTEKRREDDTKTTRSEAKRVHMTTADDSDNCDNGLVLLLGLGLEKRRSLVWRKVLGKTTE